MKVKKLLALFLCAVLLATVLPLAAVKSDAQTAPWFFVVGDKTYSNATALNAAGITGLRAEGNTLFLNNYTGTGLGIYTGGSVVGDVDAPNLYIVLSGESTLTGSSDIITDAVVGLYAVPRGDNYGDDSNITVSGSGTLNIKISKSKVKTSLYGAVCGDSFLVTGGKVSINVSGSGVTGQEVIGIDATTVRASSSGCIDIKANASAYINRRNPADRASSTANVYGIRGNVKADANKGYLSVDTSGSATSGTVLCVSRDVTYNNANSALFLIGMQSTLYGGTMSIPSSWKENVTYRHYEFTNSIRSTLHYVAYGPIDYASLNYNTSLTPVSAQDVYKTVTLPELNSAKPSGGNFTKYSDAHVYAKYYYYLEDIESGQAYPTSYWSNFNENEEGQCYELEVQYYPLPGYWFINEAFDLTTQDWEDCFNYPTIYSYLYGNNYASFGLIYTQTSVTAQPKAVGVEDGYISVVAQNDIYNLNYLWYLSVYKDDLTKPAAVIPMTDFDEMNYGFSYQNCDEMSLGSLDYNETVPDCEFTFGEADALTLYCQISSPFETRLSNEVAYNAFGTCTIVTQPSDSNLNGTAVATFTVEAKGESLKYEWLYDGQPLKSNENTAYFSGANTKTLTVLLQSPMGLALYSGKEFTCRITNAYDKTVTTKGVKIINGSSYIPGDIDDDGKVTASDARLGLRAAVGLTGDKDTKGNALSFSDKSGRAFLAADVDKNTKLDASDARSILRAAVGLEELK